MFSLTRLILGPSENELEAAVTSSPASLASTLPCDTWPAPRRWIPGTHLSRLHPERLASTHPVRLASTHPVICSLPIADLISS